MAINLCKLAVFVPFLREGGALRYPPANSEIGWWIYLLKSKIEREFTLLYKKEVGYALMNRGVQKT